MIRAFGRPAAILVAVMFAFFFPYSASGQTEAASIDGVVRDQQGAVDRTGRARYAVCGTRARLLAVWSAPPHIIRSMRFPDSGRAQVLIRGIKKRSVETGLGLEILGGAYRGKTALIKNDQVVRPRERSDSMRDNDNCLVWAEFRNRSKYIVLG